jgi:glutamyl-tRNA synthetase
MNNDIILRLALQNAIEHNGKANFNALLGHIIALEPDIKKEMREWAPIISEIIEKVNALSLSEQREKLEAIAPELLIKKKIVEHRTLENLPNVTGPVRMRLAPSPSGPLHIGHSRMAILNDEYVKRYGGKLFLRLEDTNPHNIEKEAYKMIQDDLTWLQVKYDEVVIQSDRFDMYYEFARKLLEMNKAYITLCKEKEWRALKIAKKACPDRDLEPELQLERWDKMLAGDYNNGEAVFVVKTDLEHPNPAIRDWAALRIIKHANHPLLKNRYIVYPLMNFSVAVDDYLLNLTHVLRGKDHLNNTYRQLYLFRYFGWPVPEYIHYGKVRIKDTFLKTSLIKKGIKEKQFRGWDDPRLGTLKAIANRGIDPNSIRRYWIDVGIKDVDIEFSWENLYAYDRDIIEKDAKRLFYVWNPVQITVKNREVLRSMAPYHPSRKELGNREYTFEGDFKVHLTSDDWNAIEPGKIFRLKDLCNITKLDANSAEYSGNDLSIIKKSAKIVHWVPANSEKCKVYMPDGTVLDGLLEPLASTCANSVVQFERFGFVNLKKERKYSAYFAHR